MLRILTERSKQFDYSSSCHGSEHTRAYLAARRRRPARARRAGRVAERALSHDAGHARRTARCERAG